MIYEHLLQVYFYFNTAFWLRKVYNFQEFQFPYCFSFAIHAFDVIKYLLPSSKSWRCIQVVSSQNFGALILTFMSLIHFELIFTYGMRQGSKIPLHVDIQLSQNHLLGRTYFSLLKHVCTVVENKLIIDLWVYLWTLNSILLTYVVGGDLVTKSCPTLVTPWTVAWQLPLSMGFSRQQYWSGLWFPFSRGSSWPHCRQILYLLSYEGSLFTYMAILMLVTYYCEYYSFLVSF